MALELFVIDLLNTCFLIKGETSLRMGNPMVHPFTLGCIFQIHQILNSSVTTNSLFKCVTNQEYVCVCVFMYM